MCIRDRIKGLGNRLAGLINRLTIISAAGYYANIAIIADLIDRDRYSSFEKIEAAARKEALAFANQKKMCIRDRWKVCMPVSARSRMWNR